MLQLPRACQRQESPFVFYPRYGREIVSKHARLLALAWRYDRIHRRVEADPAASTYRDQALTPVSDDETGTLEIFNATDGRRKGEAAEAAPPAARHRRLIVPTTAPARTTARCAWLGASRRPSA